MPKVKTQLDEYELRITPPDGAPITDWLIDERISNLLCCSEGGEGTDKRLHYHCIIKTTMSRNTMVKWIYTVARCKEERGNSVFFSRQPHENSYGYVLKQGHVVCRHGYDQTFIEEWITKSDEYLRSKEAKRKRHQRSKQGQLDDIVDKVADILQKDPNIAKESCRIVSMILQQCHSNNLQFPTRSQMERIVIKLLYPYDSASVENYYMRSFPITYNYH